MISLYKPIIVNKDLLFGSIFKELKDKYQFDICYIIMFDDSGNYATVLDSFPNEAVYKLETEYINLRESNHILNLLLKEKKVVICDKELIFFNECQYKHLLLGVSKEVYIPVSSLYNDSKEIIGCVYLAAKKSKPNFNFDFLNKEGYLNSFSIVYYAFNIIYEKYREKKKFLSLANIFCEIYKNQYEQINHLFNVGYWSLLIASELELNEKQRYKLYIAAILHDVGTLYLPQELMNKNGRFTKKEYETMKKHSIYGANIIREITNGLEELNDIDIIIKHHHERYDGEGYPDNLKGEEIPLFSRIIAVADAMDSMMSERTYKNQLEVSRIIDEFKFEKNKQFDEKLADIIIRLIVKQKRDTEAILGPVTWGTLLISNSMGNYDVQGDLVKRLHGYEFISNEFDFKDSKFFIENEIKSCSFIVIKSGVIYEFSVKFTNITTNKFFIKEVILKPTNQYFSMFWDLYGEVKENNGHIMDVGIRQVGGNIITFYTIIDGQERIFLNNVYSLRITFEDGEIIEIAGQIIRKYKSDTYEYYDFEFNNINEHIRDKIFKQLFQKQSEVRRML